jgi:hypothetical protein
MTYTRVLLLHEPVKVFAGQMFFSSQKHVQDQVTLSRAFEPRSLDMFEKYFLLFRHGSVFLERPPPRLSSATIKHGRISQHMTPC